VRPSADPQGNPRGSLAPAPAPAPNLAPPPPVPDPPEHLGPHARAVWAEVWEAGGPNYVPKTDRYVIARYAELHERIADLRSIIEREGWVAAGSKGQDIQHPAARLLYDAEAKLTTLEDRLGLNPEARLRLGISAIEKETKLDAFLKGAESN
jgi:P27 family predicted phage terminase small subunit